MKGVGVRGLAAALAVMLLIAGPLVSLSGQAKSASSVPPESAGISLLALATELKASLSWDPLTGSGILERGGDRLSLALGQSIALWNYRERLSLEPLTDGPGGPALRKADAEAIEARFARAREARRSHYSVAAILIDPGHGGKDSGAVGEHMVEGKRLRVVEKDIALEVSLQVYESLKKRYPDMRVFISRSKDRYPTLEERVEMANEVELEENEAIIYVSIHTNASFNKNARGFEVWYLNPDYRRTLLDKKTAQGLGEDIAPIINYMLEEEFTTESIILARNILTGLQAKIGTESPNRGVRAEEWFVVRNARMPSVLVELGFVTNPEEARLLSRPEYLRQLSTGIYNGIVDFVGYFETMKGPPAP